MLVEGKDDVFALAELLELAGIAWKPPPVFIEEADGITQLLKPAFISTPFKTSRMKMVGIVVDANGDPESRWRQLRSVLGTFYPDIPRTFHRRGWSMRCPIYRASASG